MKNFLTETARKLAPPLVVLLLLAGCCPRKDYPYGYTAYIRFVKPLPAASLDTAVSFKRVYAIGGRGDLIDSSGRIPRSYASGGYPLSVANDKTTYIFESANQTDTLTVGYRRTLEYISRECGARVYIGNLRLIQPTTFKKVTVSGNAIQITL